MSTDAAQLEVALIVVGDELLSGTRRDGNGGWLVERLSERGASVVGLEIIGDAADQVAGAVRRAVARARVVLVSGGLGPTDDDGTRAGIAAAFDVPLVEDAEALRQVEEAQRVRGFALDDRRRREALLPRGASPLANPDGTAPGIQLPFPRSAGPDGVLFALPGVPREVRRMYDTEVVPRIGGLGVLPRRPSAAFRVAGVREPDVAETLADLTERADGVQLGFYPHEGELEIRLTAVGAEKLAAVEAAAGEARRRLAPTYPDERIEVFVVGELACLGLELTTAESMTGGLIARMLTGVPGASDVLPGGWVTYSDAWKIRELGVDASLIEREGVVSLPVAAAMAEGARKRAGVDVALSVTGYAGPGDGLGPNGRPIPSGTFYVGLAFRGRETIAKHHVAPHARRTVQRRAAVAALDLLRRALAP